MEMKELLLRVREAQKLNMRQFAEKIGVPYPAYRKYEVEGVMPPAVVIIKIAQALQVSADYILGLRDTPRPNEVSTEKTKKALALLDTLRACLND